MIKWFTKQNYTTRAAIIGGVFAVLATIIGGAFAIFSAIIPIIIDRMSPPTTVTMNSNGRVLFEEDFEDGSADLMRFAPNSEWKVIHTKSGSVLDIDNSNGTDYTSVDFGSSSWADYAIEYRVQMFNLIDEAPEVILEFRRNIDGSDKYIQAFTPDYNSVSLNLTLGGKGWQPLQLSVLDFSVETWYLVRVEIKGSVIRVVVNNKSLIDTIDFSLKSGLLNLQTGPGSHVQFDDIRIYELR